MAKAAAKRSAKAAVPPADRMIFAVMGPYRGLNIYAGEDYDQCIAEGWAVPTSNDQPTDEIPDLDDKIAAANAMAQKWAGDGGPVISQAGPPEFVLAITALIPDNAVVGADDLMVQVLGSLFVDGATVMVDGAAQTTMFASDSELSAILSPRFLPVGAKAVVVQNPDLQVSAPATFTITGSAAPTLTGLNPATALVEAPEFDVLCSGTGFLLGAQAFAAGAPLATSFVSEVQVVAKLSGVGQTVGTVPVSVRNPDAQETGSRSFTFSAASRSAEAGPSKPAAPTTSRKR